MEENKTFDFLKSLGGIIRNFDLDDSGCVVDSDHQDVLVPSRFPSIFFYV